MEAIRCFIVSFAAVFLMAVKTDGECPNFHVTCVIPSVPLNIINAENYYSAVLHHVDMYCLKHDQVTDCFQSNYQFCDADNQRAAKEYLSVIDFVCSDQGRLLAEWAKDSPCLDDNSVNDFEASVNACKSANNFEGHTDCEQFRIGFYCWMQSSDSICGTAMTDLDIGMRLYDNPNECPLGNPSPYRKRGLLSRLFKDRVVYHPGVS